MKNFVEHYKELGIWMKKLGQAIPNTMQGFGSMHEGTIKDGAMQAVEQFKKESL